MGYTTYFTGRFDLDRPLTAHHAAYLNAFSRTRRMRRDARIVANMDDPVRLAAGLPVGDDGAYFVGGEGFVGQDRDASILDCNGAPTGQPGLWCQWAPTADGRGVAWDGAEKFYAYVEWLEYLVEHFLRPWGYVLNGAVEWAGEDRDDLGQIVVTDNVVTTRRGTIVYLDDVRSGGVRSGGVR